LFTDLTPIKTQTWDNPGGMKDEPTVRYISYAEGIRLYEGFLEEDWNDTWFDKEESLESLNTIIRWTIKKIMQDHC